MAEKRQGKSLDQLRRMIMADKDTKPADRKPADKDTAKQREAEDRAAGIARQKDAPEPDKGERKKDANENVDQPDDPGLPSEFVSDEKYGKTLEQQAREEQQEKGAPQAGMAVSGHPGATAGTKGNAPAPPNTRAANPGEVAQGYRVVEESKPAKDRDPDKFKAEIKKLPDAS